MNRFIPRGSVVLAVTTFGSYILGLLRDRLLAQTFGASAALDSYNAAFLLPDFMFNLLVASGIAAAGVPLFTQAYKRHHEQAYEYMNALLMAAIEVMALVSVGMIIFAPWLSYLVAPGLDTAGHQLITQMMRVIAFSPILFAASNALGALLIAQKRFLFYGLSPMVYNLGIIVGTLLLAPHWGVRGVAYGTVAGAALHLLVRLWDAWRSGWRWELIGRWWQRSIMKQTIRLMIPKMIGHPVELVTFWVFTSLASLLAPGSITVLNFARNFQSVPVSLLGIAMSTAVFPQLAEASLHSKSALSGLFRRTTATILLTSILAAITVFLIRRPLIAILLGGGAFTSSAITRTAVTLGIFCLSIPTESLSHLMARAFYATNNTTVPVIFSVISLAISSVSAYLLMQVLDIAGLPLGFFFGSLVKTVGLYIVFERRLNRSLK